MPVQTFRAHAATLRLQTDPGPVNPSRTSEFKGPDLFDAPDDRVTAAAAYHFPRLADLTLSVA